MRSTVIVSPHLDDAVLSCWGALDGGGEAVVLNVFTGVPPPGMLTGWDAGSGAPDSATRVARRHREDRDALAVAGRPARYLGLLEGQYGGRGVEPEDLRPHLPEDADVWIPAGIGVAGVNAEHVAVRDAVLALRRDATLYADQPYCRFRPDLELPPGLADGRRRVLVELTPRQRERKALALLRYAGEIPKLERDHTPFAHPRHLAHELCWPAV
jgi:hypothetical protein